MASSPCERMSLTMVLMITKSNLQCKFKQSNILYVNQKIEKKTTPFAIMLVIICPNAKIKDQKKKFIQFPFG